jgi:hypothetical protein
MLSLALSLVAIPIPDVDAPYFLVAAHRFANGLGLTNPYFSLVPDDPAAYLTWHGWLYSWLIGLLPSSSNYATILFGPALIGITAVLLYSLYLARKCTAFTLSCSVPPILVFGLYFISWGRPELLASLLFCAALPLLPRFAAFQTQAVLAVLLALITVTHPAIALMCAMLIIGGHGVLGVSTRAFLRSMAIFLTLTPLVIAALTWALMDFSVGDWIHGLYVNAQYTAHRMDPGGFAHYYIASRAFPGVLLIFPLLALAWGRWASLTPRKAFPVALTALATVGGLVWVWYFALRLPATCYNFLAFGPLIVIGTAWMTDFGPPVASAHVLRVTRILQLSFSVVAMMGITYNSIVNWDSFEHGLSLRTLQDRMSLFAGREIIIAAPDAFAEPIAEILGTSHVMSYPGARNHPEQRTANPELAPVIILKQSESGIVGAPPVPSGYQIFFDQFERDPIRLFGIEIKKERNDWAFAILCRDEICNRLPHL